MRIPTVGEKLHALYGTVYLVENVDIVDDEYWLVSVVLSAHADEMDAVGEELDPEEFVVFCQEHGISYV